MKTKPEVKTLSKNPRHMIQSSQMLPTFVGVGVNSVLFQSFSKSQCEQNN